MPRYAAHTLQMTRNIVICCDAGFNWFFGEGLTNVLKLYLSILKDDSQVCFYHSGIRSKAEHKSWLESGLKALKGVAKLDAVEFVFSLFGPLLESDYIKRAEHL